MRQSMILHNQYRWTRKTSSSTEVGKLQDDDYVVHTIRATAMCCNSSGE